MVIDQSTLIYEFFFLTLSRDTRNNLQYLKNGNIVYHAAALGIVMDVASNTQR